MEAIVIVPYLKHRNCRAKKCHGSLASCHATFIGKSRAHSMSIK